MAVYAYKGLNTKGKAVKGTFDAENLKELRASLKRKGIFLTEYREAAERGKRGGGARRAESQSEPAKKSVLNTEIDVKAMFQRVKLLEVAEGTRNLATLARAGIPIVESLAALIEQTPNEKLKSVLSEVRQRVVEGAAFADALEQHPQIFSRLYVNMVRAGESSGNLDMVLSRLADFIQGQVRLRAKVSAALTYPAVMAVVGLGVVTLLMVVVIPKMVNMFDQMSVELPLPTRILIGASNGVRDYWWLLLILLGVGISTFRRWKKSEKGRPRWDRMALKTPIIGKLLQEIALARFCRTMGTLLSSGVPLLGSLEIVKAILDNHVLEAVVDQAQVEVREGASLAAPLKQSGYFPPMVTQMIAIGEQSGQLESMLLNAAEAYEVQVDSKVQMLTSILEPVIIVVMGGFVGGLIASILMPMLKMNEAFQAIK